VNAIIDDAGTIIKNFEPEIKRTVLSIETSKTLAGIMAEGVATGGSARNAFVKGYGVAAKTGTSQKTGGNDDDTARIGSCAAFAPADNPQVVILIIVDEPDLRVSSVYGGVIAAPFVSKTLEDTLRYLSIEPQYTDKEIEELEVLVKGYLMQKVSAAAEDIISKGLSYVVEGSGEFIRAQIPKQGSKLRKGGKVILYTDSSPENNLVTVPNVLNTTAETANKRITDAGLNINIDGVSNMNSSAAAYKQEPEAGENVPKGTIVTVKFRHGGSD
jgi:stage V sporulation protein D (sporulation-specific penicillin-binding protein)